MGIISDLLASIPAYTGLSPVSFFTVLALVVALCYLVSGAFVSASKDGNVVRMAPLHTPVQLGDVTEEELLAYDGREAEKPLLMAIKGQIYDVSQSRMFYGPGGPYAAFAGKDASRALAKMSFEEEDLTGNTEGLSPFELDALQDWEWKFTAKYAKVGQIVTKSRDLPEADDSEVSNEVASEEKVEKNKEESDENIEESKEQLEVQE